MSSTPVWTTVTAALHPGRFMASRRARGRPMVSPRPITTTCFPSTGTSLAASSSTMPAGVHGQRPVGPHDQAAQVDRVEPVDVLVGIHGQQHPFLVEAGGQRQLDQVGVDRWGRR